MRASHTLCMRQEPELLAITLASLLGNTKRGLSDTTADLDIRFYYNIKYTNLAKCEYILLNKLGKWYRLSLKSLSDKKEIWVESLVGSNKKENILKWLKKNILTTQAR